MPTLTGPALAGAEAGEDLSLRALLRLLGGDLGALWTSATSALPDGLAGAALATTLLGACAVGLHLRTRRRDRPTQPG